MTGSTAGARPARWAGAALVVALALAACSSSGGGPPAGPQTHAGGSPRAAGPSGSGPGGGAPGGSASGSAGATVLGDNPGCHLLSAADVTAAAGKALPAMTGNAGGGLTGNSGHESCLYTADSTAHGAYVHLDINTFASGASGQLATLRTALQSQVDSRNGETAGSASLKDAAVGDGGFVAVMPGAVGNDETVWFTKGPKVVEVEVGGGPAGSALTLAQKVAGKV